MKTRVQPVRECALTLTECLVGVVMCSVLLIDLFGPFKEVRRKSRIKTCIANQRVIGEAYFAYAKDNQDRLPVIAGFAAAGGQVGNFPQGANAGKARINVAAHLYGAPVPAAKRPLNEYVDDIRCFHCPADHGGGAYNVKSCWQAFGNSYQPQVADDMFRVKRVLGESSEKKGSYEATSMTLKEINRSPKNKIIQGDFNWPFDESDSWHAAKGEAGHVILFGDGHAEYFVFPPTEKMKKWHVPPMKPDRTIDNEKWRKDSGEPFDYIDPKYKWW